MRAQVMRAFHNRTAAHAAKAACKARTDCGVQVEDPFPFGGLLKQWRKTPMKELQTRCRANATLCAHGDVYEFGVYTGRALRAMFRLFNSRSNGFPVRRVWGFDSFEGIPRDAATAAASTQYANAVNGSSGGFREAAFSVGALLASRNLVDWNPIDVVDAYVNEPRLRLIPGFFETSLTPALAAAHGMRPAIYVDVDCDIYRATVSALTWMVQNRLIVPGTILGYDDWGYGTAKEAGAPLEGEPRAHEEVIKRFGMVLSPVRGTVQSGPKRGTIGNQAAFVVVSIGSIA
jgi:hypothetical protein